MEGNPAVTGLFANSTYDITASITKLGWKKSLRSVELFIPFQQCSQKHNSTKSCHTHIHPLRRSQSKKPTRRNDLRSRDATPAIRTMGWSIACIYSQEQFAGFRRRVQSCLIVSAWACMSMIWRQDISDR
jgi:hypothetical protein